MRAKKKKLARLTDTDEIAKKAYVTYYKDNDPAYYSKGLQMIDRTIHVFCGKVSDSQRDELVVDMVYFLHRFGCMFDEYFLYHYPILNTKG